MSILSDYLHEIGQYPLLTPEEELKLASTYRDSENEDEREWAREQLINSNLRLVVHIAKNYHNSHMELMDLINEGTLGLMTAVEKYNPDLGYRFSTCATPWIKQAITKSIIDKGKTIRTPAHIYQLIAKYRQAVEKLSGLGKEFDEKDIANEMGIDVDKVKDIEAWKQDTVSLSSPLGDEGEDTLEDLQADLHSEGPQAYVERKEFEKYIQTLIETLKPRTQTIIKLRYGLGTEKDPEEFQKEHTLEEIGEYVGITRERVRQIEKETLADLKARWMKK